MKKLILFISFISAAFAFQSCERIVKGITFGFNIRGNFELPPNIPANLPFNLPGIPVSYDIAKEFENQGTKAELVKEIKISYFRMKIEEPIGEDFSFVKDIELRLSKDGEDDKLIAWKYNIDDNIGQDLELEVTPDALDRYLKTSGFSLKVSVTTDEVTSQEYKISYDIRTSVKADPFD